MIRVIAIFIISLLTIVVSVTFIEPPSGIIIGMLLGGFISGLFINRVRTASLIGLFSGALGYLTLYILSGGGILGFMVYKELLGIIGLLLPFLYYSISCMMIAFITSFIRLKMIRS